MGIKKPAPMPAPPQEGGLSGKIKNSFVRWFAEFSEGFWEFSTFVLGRGGEVILDALGQAFAPVLRPLLQLAIDTGKIPPQLQPLIDEIMNPSGEISAMLGSSAGGAGVGGIVSSTIGPFLLLLQYEMQQVAKQARLDPSTLAHATFRDTGFQDLFNRDMADMGYNEERAQAILKVMETIPGVSDIVRFANREAYDDGYAARWGSDDEFPNDAMPDIAHIGMAVESFKKQWRAHWIIPSVGQGFTMLHRLRPGTGGPEFTTTQLRDLLFAQDVMPGWRPYLEAISFSPFTRVDARRMWDVGALNDTELLAAYQDVGFDADKAGKMVLFTKLFERLPELRARFRNNWISSSEFLSELLAFGVPSDRAQAILETSVKADAPVRTQTERNLTKADILKGVKRETISADQGVQLLIGIGYDAAEAEFLLAINAPVDKRVTAEKDREVSKADVLAALKEDVISRDDAFNRLLELRYTPFDAELLLGIMEARARGEAPPAQRQLTKADIVKGVTSELLTRGEGFQAMLDVGYAEEQANFLLTIAIEAAAESPISFSEFQVIVDAQRRTQGETVASISPAVIAAEHTVNRLKAQIAAMKRQRRELDDIAPVIGELGEAEAALFALLTPTTTPPEEAPAS